MQVIIFGNLRTRLNSMMSSLDYIVLIIIICAAGLAFIVLYNLTNINITERVREIATIKVLGFFRRETSAYVLRENLVLTAMGTAAGIGAGILLHRFVMAQIKVDLVDFGVKILPESYAYSIALTFIFNFIVNLFMEIKLERINMAESLKSIE
jgi:putative ABC transport system permease protein